MNLLTSLTLTFNKDQQKGRKQQGQSLHANEAAFVNASA